jgi:hypothetical protein
MRPRYPFLPGMRATPTPDRRQFICKRHTREKFVRWCRIADARGAPLLATDDKSREQRCKPLSMRVFAPVVARLQESREMAEPDCEMHCLTCGGNI